VENERLQSEFAQCMAECERQLYGYILGFVPVHADAQDILQDTAVRLWKNFDKYDRSLPFGAWARKFAHTQVLKAVEKGKYRVWMSRRFKENEIDELAEV